MFVDVAESTSDEQQRSPATLVKSVNSTSTRSTTNDSAAASADDGSANGADDDHQQQQHADESSEASAANSDSDEHHSATMPTALLASSMNVSAAATEKTVIKDGWLERKKTGLRTNWERRFYVVTSNGVLHERITSTTTVDKAAFHLGLARIASLPRDKKIATFHVQVIVAILAKSLRSRLKIAVFHCCTRKQRRETSQRAHCTMSSCVCQTACRAPRMNGSLRISC
jgi:hypothetical protein